ncbi:MAG: trypsin-like peptidase domain-containing protein [Ardenticatenia bacterium]|nr:trypsin-like peptidase domain-containing protein [Ardenticatenia bacterium]
MGWVHARRLARHPGGGLQPRQLPNADGRGAGGQDQGGLPSPPGGTAGPTPGGSRRGRHGHAPGLAGRGAAGGRRAGAPAGRPLHIAWHRLPGGGTAGEPGGGTHHGTFPSGRYHGTGFLIGPDLLLTNHHVLYDQDHGDARATEVDLLLDYEESFSGKLREGHGFVGLPASIVGDKADDWAVIRLAEAPDAAYPRLPLAGGPVTVDDPVFIVQHPGGRPKEIGLTRNLVRHVGADRVQYLTDTEGGSSGSPVFNARWQVVAVHHKWTTVGGPGAGAGREYRNQGVAIGRVAAGLRAAGVVVANA